MSRCGINHSIYESFISRIINAYGMSEHEGFDDIFEELDREEERIKARQKIRNKTS